MESKLLNQINVEKLPESLQDLVDCIGVTAAYQLSLHFGGQPLYVPKNPERSVLLKRVGYEALNKLSYRFAGATIEIPKHDHFDRQLRDLAIIEESLRGASRKELAQKYGLCLRHIGNIRKGAV
ncbi:Mor transcription activator family protein [Spartinivicinus ruber]|uniref:Mor transcription activator family protein n=1 Tax=Spartinivicinus ruber TaxID=2683272 RepID=UPI0013D1DC0B|nr:Mor transcription activator family protein [Spartinivicinus ruber]